jgi:CHAD domain-containing protein
VTDKPVVEREVERKITVPPVFSLPDLVSAVPAAASVARGESYELLATYFDTADLRLARWGITLRRRRGGKDEGWHLKLPAWKGQVGDRDEIQLPLDASADTPPAVFLDATAPLTRGAALVPVATLRTSRTPVELSGETGMVVRVVDDTVSVEDGSRLLARFRELEVELVDGDYDSLDAAVKVLLDAGGVVGTRPKLVSALGPRALAAADVPAPSFGDLTSPSWVVVQATIAHYVRAFLLQDVRVRLNLPDSVHQLRVSARRLRSALRTYRPLLDREWADALRLQLGTAAGALGDARDLEVQRKRLDRDADLLPGDLTAAARAVIDPVLVARQATARKAGLQQLRSPEHAALVDLLVESALYPQFTEEAQKPAGETLPELLADSWTRLAKEVRKLTPEADEDQWHRARIVAKRARYASEALAPVLGNKVGDLAAILAAVTDELGTLQDTAVARLLISDLALNEPGTAESGYALGLLDGVEVAAARACRDAFREIWPLAKDAARAAGTR